MKVLIKRNVELTNVRYAISKIVMEKKLHLDFSALTNNFDLTI